MKVLFATHDGADFLASTLWDGLQELLGWENVYDAGNNPDFHLIESPEKTVVCTTTNQMLCSTRPGKRLQGEENFFDLLVINSCFRHQYKDWHWPWQLRKHMKTNHKVAFVEGGDSAIDVNDPRTESGPPYHAHAVFRREINPGFGYPYDCHHLDFACPKRWLDETRQKSLNRTIDVCLVCGPGSNPVRWEMMKYVFATRRTYTFAYAHYSTEHPFSPQEYHDLLRRSRMALCPPGGNDCSSTMRVWDILGAGAIPLFVRHQQRRRAPDYPHLAQNWCWDLDRLSQMIEHLLACDLDLQRPAYLDEIEKNHTTLARAKKLVEIVGA